MTPKVYVSRMLPEKAIEMLKKECDLKINSEDRVLTKSELIKNIVGIDGLLCLLTDTIDAEVLDAAGKKLKIVANYAVGYNNIDVNVASTRKIAVTNTPGVLTETTADLTWALLMSIARRIPESDRFTREGKFVGWAPMMFLGSDVFGKTLGIVGFGRIGYAVAERATGFKMKILYYEKDVVPAAEKVGAKKVELQTLLKESDFITLHVPLTPETKHLISEKEFALMKPTAYLINSSRGPVIDEKVLVKVLQEKKIAGAALDVYEEEPNLVSGLDKLDNAVIVPHIGSATIETRTKMATMAAENILAYFRGQKPPNLVNPEIFGK